MSAAEIDYICVGICQIDADSGSCLGCGRPPPPSPDAESAIAAVDAYCRPAASEFTTPVSAEPS